MQETIRLDIGISPHSSSQLVKRSQAESIAVENCHDACALAVYTYLNY
jgi:hypothetical protein